MLQSFVSELLKWWKPSFSLYSSICPFTEVSRTEHRNHKTLTSCHPWELPSSSTSSGVLQAGYVWGRSLLTIWERSSLRNWGWIKTDSGWPLYWTPSDFLHNDRRCDPLQLQNVLQRYLLLAFRCLDCSALSRCGGKCYRCIKLPRGLPSWAPALKSGRSLTLQCFVSVV